jgi:hypothetical protein
MPDPLLLGLMASIACTPLALLRRSWPLMTAAALLSLFVSVHLGDAGLLLTVVPCLQAALAVALRWELRGFGIAPLLLVGSLVWLGETDRLVPVLRWAVPVWLIAAGFALLVPSLRRPP